MDWRTPTSLQITHIASLVVSFFFLPKYSIWSDSFVRVYIVTRFDMIKLRILLLIILLFTSTSRPMLPFYCLLHLDLDFDEYIEVSQSA